MVMKEPSQGGYDQFSDLKLCQGIILVLLYVDDMIITGSDLDVISILKQDLNHHFEMKDLSTFSYFLGLEVSTASDGYYLSQAAYASDLLSRAGLTDSKPSLLLLSLITHKERAFDTKPFRFEASWTRDPTSHLVVKSAWSHHQSGTPEHMVCWKIDKTRLALRKWNISHFGHIQTRIKQLTNFLDLVQQSEQSTRNLELEKNIRLELDEQCRRKECLWHQKSTLRWRCEGDLNTKFFHLSTIIRRKSNSIDFLKDQSEKWISKREETGDCFNKNFQTFFTSSNPDFPPDLENLIYPMLTASDISMLCEIPSFEEISKVLMNFESLKAPGPGGMPALFFKSY
ncbi:hypothetical protein RJ639_006086 [Escallonia herrerae]|uniref:Reverse transcriptase Ty1/copia-type domain-containing protein n=1 Tax=Escallonia herrerae TaxID=1293975 RepID=A0AA88VXM2_9ASTE|nr:hypothetical protein RJ639_006086 [Escallonia herrerae]